MNHFFIAPLILVAQIDPPPEDNFHIIFYSKHYCKYSGWMGFDWMMISNLILKFDSSSEVDSSILNVRDYEILYEQIFRWTTTSDCIAFAYTYVSYSGWHILLGIWTHHRLGWRGCRFGEDGFWPAVGHSLWKFLITFSNKAAKDLIVMS